MMEIERKFVLREVPERARLGPGVAIAQGYLQSGLRLRRKGDRYYLTLKGAGALSHEEWETEMPAWAFARLWPLTAQRRLEKTRYEVPEGPHTLEVDEYHGRLAGLWTLECEFSSEAEAGAFSLPAWAASALDVTADYSYRNSNLAVCGLPAGAPVHRP
ncbi:MAG: CYTH domain-containing protein [Deltaproteobacteria bacterium]|nr:CYTH domain-containing protein [Deltaproteobacteria bacterium]